MTREKYIYINDAGLVCVSEERPTSFDIDCIPSGNPAIQECECKVLRLAVLESGEIVVSMFTNDGSEVSVPVAVKDTMIDGQGTEQFHRMP